MLGIKRVKAGCRQVGSYQQEQSAGSIQPNSIQPTLFTATVAKAAKKEGNSAFLSSFACFASVVVKLLLLADH